MKRLIVPPLPAASRPSKRIRGQLVVEVALIMAAALLVMVLFRLHDCVHTQSGRRRTRRKVSGRWIPG